MIFFTCAHALQYGVAITLFRATSFMSIEKVRELLAKLHDEVQKTELDAASTNVGYPATSIDGWKEG